MRLPWGVRQPLLSGFPPSALFFLLVRRRSSPSESRVISNLPPPQVPHRTRTTSSATSPLISSVRVLNPKPHNLLAQCMCIYTHILLYECVIASSSYTFVLVCKGHLWMKLCIIITSSSYAFVLVCKGHLSMRLWMIINFSHTGFK